MSSSNAFEESKDKALEVLATHLSDDELVDFSNYNMQGAHSPEDRGKLMSLTNKHQHALWELGEAMIDCEVGGAGALEVFVDMLVMIEEALGQLRQTRTSEDSAEVGGGSPRTELGQID